jgi:hypothetical protein
MHAGSFTKANTRESQSGRGNKPNHPPDFQSDNNLFFFVQEPVCRTYIQRGYAKLRLTGGEAMTITKKLFAAPLAAIIVGAPLPSACAQTYTYTRTVTSYDSPILERIVESPVIMESHPVLIDSMIPDTDLPVAVERRIAVEHQTAVEKPVIIERSFVLEPETVVERPLVIKKHEHHVFHLGLFPLGVLDLF